MKSHDETTREGMRAVEQTEAETGTEVVAEITIASANDGADAGRVRPKRARRRTYRMARGVAMLIVLGFVVASLIWHTGGGTLSAVGFSSIAAVCPLGGLEALVAGRTFMLHPIVLLVVALMLTLVFGKAFCAWACPTTYIQRFFRGSKKQRKQRDGTSDRQACEGHTACSRSCNGCASLGNVGGKRDGLHLDSRHAVLGGALLSAAVFGFPVFCLVCPVGLVFATLTGLWYLFQFNETTWGLLLFPAILLIEVVFFRKWCKRICPIAALLSLISAGNKTFKPAVDSSKCLRTSGIDCTTCVDTCPEELDPHSASIPECTKCGKCVDACPAQAISIKLLAKQNKRAVVADRKGE